MPKGGSRPPVRPDDGRLRDAKVVQRKIHLPPDLSKRVDRWLADNPQRLSGVVSELIDIYLTEKGY